ncbi:RodZ domain-containing protein [Marinobacter bohaiensis]|uniref:RodZ domain-containing protein n=1 Tax=Marinobacter bohaiensis TaxID=2201898 RepID=UPI000DAD25DE|nr:helix-turn-helix domain-containing protein [Marinobacter bohaiensis]
MTNDDTQEIPVAEAVTGEVGNQLRRARESKGISITDVADSQHLRPSIIQAIEEGQYEKIGSELFLKGYVRAYAEQVGLDPRKLVDQLDLELMPMREEEEQARRDNPLESIERKKRQKRRVARWTLIILLIAVVAGIGYRVMETELFPGGISGALDTSDPAPSEDVNEAATAESQIDGEADGSVVDQTAADDSADNATAFGEPVEDASASSAADSPEAAENDAGMPAGNDPESTSATTQDDMEQPAATDQAPSGDGSDMSEAVPAAVAPDAAAPVAEPEASSDEASAPAPENPPVTPTSPDMDLLTASFTGDCWVSIKNAEGTTVVASLKRAGESLRYEGRGPFQIVLGAADAATLRFNGEAVDLSVYPASNNRVALTVGN